MFRSPHRTAAIGLLAAVLLVGCDAAAVDPSHLDDHARGHEAMHGDGEDSPAIDDAPVLEVTADAMAFDPDRIELAVGEPVNLALRSVDIFHDLEIDEVDFHVGADAGETTTGGVVFDEPGTYVAYCSVPGHRAGGMELELVVD